jgi:nicotinamidase-related amidase
MRVPTRRELISLPQRAAVLWGASSPLTLAAVGASADKNREKHVVPTTPSTGPVLALELQRRDATGKMVRTTASLAASKIAVIVVDMWTAHYCSGATEGMRALIPAMNRALVAVRDLGIPIIFASAGDDLQRWAGKPQRRSIVELPQRQLPPSSGFLGEHTGLGPHAAPCMCRIAAVERDTREPVFACKKMQSNYNQHPGLLVTDRDVFIAAGQYRPSVKWALNTWGEVAKQELWNFAQSRGITHLLYIGCATNMCVINREFGMIMMRRAGLETILVRDQTAAITFNGYNPFTHNLDASFGPDIGTQYAIQHIEEKIGPSITSQQLLYAALQGAGC